MIYVTDASYVDGYKLQVAFSNDAEGVIDFLSVLKHDHRPIFNDLLDVERFKQFRVDADTIVWENGLDLAPEFLLEKLIPITTL
jgi:hypothetical protein